MNTQEEQLSDSLLAACKAAGIEEPKYIAQDENGTVWHYQNMPTRTDNLYIVDDYEDPADRLDHPPYASEWKESILEWTDHVADTSKKMDDACKLAYQKNPEKSDGLYWSRYRQGWLDALEWKAMAEEGGASE